MTSSTECQYILQLEELLSSQDETNLALFIGNEMAMKQLSADALDVIPRVCFFFDDDVDPTPDDSFIVACCNVVDRISSLGNPKEVMIALLEQIDRFHSDTCFLSLLNPILIVMKRLSNRQKKFFKWVTDTLYSHIKTISLDNTNCDLSEKSKTRDVKNLIFRFISFLEYFIVDLSRNFSKSDPEDFKAEKKLILISLFLEILEYPIIYLEHPSLNENYQSSVEKTINHLIDINLFSLKFDESFPLNLFDGIGPLQAAAFVYFLMYSQIGLKTFPWIYSHEFKLQVCLKHCIVLLQHQHVNLISKGLELTEYLIMQLNDGTLSSGLLELKDYTELCDVLISIMISCPVDVIRRQSFQIMKSFFKRFTSKGRNHIIRYNLSKNLNYHSGVCGILIQLYKDFLHEALLQEKINEYYSGDYFTEVLKLILAPSEDAESDIVENSERLISILNFLRFILLRKNDKVNILSSDDLSLCSTFVNELMKNIQVTHAHYVLEVQNVKENKQDSYDQEEFNILPQDRINSLNCAVNTIDLIKCLAIRVEELIHHQDHL